MKSFLTLRAGLLVLVLAFLGASLTFYLIAQEEPEVVQEPVVQEPVHSVIGSSVDGRAIERFTYGDGDTHLLFVGGMHGGYEWNSVLLAYQFLDYVDQHPEVVPAELSVSIIPSLNPDGVYAVIGKEGRFLRIDVPEDEGEVGTGRFNSSGVDLNRNFDCKWQEESQWRGNVVSAGSQPFSEPEAAALRDFVLKHEPDAVIFWHSQANAVYASECEEGILPETLELLEAYTDGSGYTAIESFDAYEITGDAEGWLASLGIPAVTVELATHQTVEWERNLAGIKELFDFYSSKAK